MLIHSYLGYHYMYQGMYPVVPPWPPPPAPQGFVTKKHSYTYWDPRYAWSHIEICLKYIVYTYILWETLVNTIFTHTVVIVLDFNVVKWVVKLSLTDCSILLKSSIGSYYVISVGVLLRRFTGQTGSCMTMRSKLFLILMYLLPCILIYTVVYQNNKQEQEHFRLL